MRLLLVRHGETDWNAAGRIQGLTDIALNDAGRRQAERLYRRLHDRTIDAVYSSDLTRALETARIVAGDERLAGRRRVPLRAAGALREIAYGAWEGKTRAELEEAGHGPWLDAWVRGEWCEAPQGGEPREDVDRRVDHFLSAIFPRHVGETVLVVSHGGPLRLLIARLMGRPIAGWGAVRKANTALTEVELVAGSEPKFFCINDATHLDERDAAAPAMQPGAVVAK